MTREQEKTTMICSTKMSARTGVTRSTRQRGQRADRLKGMLTAFEAFKKKALQRKKTVKERTASPKEFTDWMYQQSNIIVGLAEKSS